MNGELIIACVGPWPEELRNKMRPLLRTTNIKVRKCSLLEKTNSQIDRTQSIGLPGWLLEKIPHAGNEQYKDIFPTLLGDNFDELASVCYVAYTPRDPRMNMVHDFLKTFPKFGRTMVVVNLDQGGVPNNVLEVLDLRFGL